MSLIEPPQELLAWLAYRCNAIAIGHVALCHHISWDEVPDMRVFFNDKLVLEGLATGFTNGAIESAVIHAQAVLEFVGLQGVSGSLNSFTERKALGRRDDFCVEHFRGGVKLTKDAALAAYPGPQAEAESAIALVFYVANKGLAHVTAGFDQSSSEARLLEIAFRGVPVLLFNSFYAPLGIAQPDYRLSFRKHS